MIKKFQPQQREECWCDDCDSSLVESDKPKTGQFYIQHGSTYNKESKDFTGDYVGVMFAICADCLSFNKLP